MTFENQEAKNFSLAAVSALKPAKWQTPTHLKQRETLNHTNTQLFFHLPSVNAACAVTRTKPARNVTIYQ
jgi:hypothetical protein